MCHERVTAEEAPRARESEWSKAWMRIILESWMNCLFVTRNEIRNVGWGRIRKCVNDLKCLSYRL
jgi:hypothetical protein